MKLKLILTCLFVIVASNLSLSQTALALDPIPIGCYGSAIKGTPTAADLALCAKIPAGCPGSNPPMPATGVPSGCKYASSYVSVADPALTPNSSGSSSSFINNYLNPFIKFLSASVGVIVVISIIIGAIQYSSAGGEAQKVAAARNRIKNAILALIVYFFLYAILQWVMPSGIGG